MSTKIYNKSNFYRHTFCVFKEVELAAIENRKADYKSKSGSSYYFTIDGVYRLSNHWGRAANCKWRLESVNSKTADRNRIGYASWNSFHADNEVEKLYFITVDFDNKTVSYSHKNAEVFPEKALLRTATETTKIIKQIRGLFDNEAWTKYFDLDDIAAIRRKIIEQLIQSNQTLQQIKNDLNRSL
jgi:hypothetical protein